MSVCINLGTDLLTSLFLSSEPAEQNMMERKPRKSAEHILSTNMIFQSYCVYGIFQTIAGYFGFFATLYYYGLPISVITAIKEDRAYIRPDSADVFVNSLALNYGNRNLSSDCRLAQTQKLNWLDESEAAFDLRHVFLLCNSDNGVWSTLAWGRCLDD